MYRTNLRHYWVPQFVEKVRQIYSSALNCPSSLIKLKFERHDLTLYINLIHNQNLLHFIASVCEINYRCGSGLRPVLCDCHFDFGKRISKRALPHTVNHYRIDVNLTYRFAPQVIPNHYRLVIPLAPSRKRASRKNKHFGRRQGQPKQRTICLFENLKYI